MSWISAYDPPEDTDCEEVMKARALFKQAMKDHDNADELVIERRRALCGASSVVETARNCLVLAHDQELARAEVNFRNAVTGVDPVPTLGQLHVIATHFLQPATDVRVEGEANVERAVQWMERARAAHAAAENDAKRAGQMVRETRLALTGALKAQYGVRPAGRDV